MVPGVQAPDGVGGVVGGSRACGVRRRARGDARAARVDGDGVGADYSAELQHIAQVNSWTFIGGARAQAAEFETRNQQKNLRDQTPALPVPLEQKVSPDFHRLSAYSYLQWQVADPLSLFGGLTYDHLQYPANHRFAPLSAGEETVDQWSPKAGLLWKITPASTLRAAYARSLGGVSLDQSVRLEPSQIAGFNQAWRGLIPESVAGAQAGARLETGAIEWDYRFRTETYLALRGEWNRSKVHRQVGVFDLPFLAEPSTTPEHLDFQETSLSVTVNQLVGKGAAFGVQYRLSNAQLKDTYPNIPESVPHFFPPSELRPRQELESTLHQVQVFGVYQHESGCFGRVEGLWFLQNNQGYESSRPGDNFCQFNVFVGYRFPRRRAEIRLGLLNILDQDYRLNPLNLTAELPRSRTLTASLRLSF